MKIHSLLNNVSYRKGGNIKRFNELQIPPNSSSNFYLSFSSRSKSLSKLCYLTACESISAARAHFHNYFLRVHLLVSANYRLESTRNLQRRVLCADCVREPVSLCEISFRYKKDTVATVEEYSLSCFFFFFFIVCFLSVHIFICFVFICFVFICIMYLSVHIFCLLSVYHIKEESVSFYLMCTNSGISRL